MLIFCYLVHITFICYPKICYRNTVILPWWESEMLREMPDMMPTPIEKNKKRTEFVINI